MRDRDYIDEERREAAKWAECSREGHVGEAFDRSHKHGRQTAYRRDGRPNNVGGINVPKVAKILTVISVIIILLSIIAGFAISSLANRYFGFFDEGIKEFTINGFDFFEDFPGYGFMPSMTRSFSVFGCVFIGIFIVCGMWAVFGIILLIVSASNTNGNGSSRKM